MLQNASIEQGGFPPWFAYNSETGNCECQRSPGTDDIVRCTEQGALLRYGFCMTYEEGQGTFVGRCQSFEVQGHINMCPKNLQGSYLSQQISQSSISTCMCGPLAIQSLMAF